MCCLHFSVKSTTQKRRKKKKTWSCRQFYPHFTENRMWLLPSVLCKRPGCVCECGVQTQWYSPPFLWRHFRSTPPFIVLTRKPFSLMVYSWLSPTRWDLCYITVDASAEGEKTKSYVQACQGTKIFLAKSSMRGRHDREKYCHVKCKMVN